MRHCAPGPGRWTPLPTARPGRRSTAPGAVPGGERLLGAVPLPQLPVCRGRAPQSPSSVDAGGRRADHGSAAGSSCACGQLLDDGGVAEERRAEVRLRGILGSTTGPTNRSRKRSPGREVRLGEGRFSQAGRSPSCTTGGSWVSSTGAGSVPGTATTCAAVARGESAPAAQRRSPLLSVAWASGGQPAASSSGARRRAGSGRGRHGAPGTARQRAVGCSLLISTMQTRCAAGASASSPAGCRSPARWTTRTSGGRAKRGRRTRRRPFRRMVGRGRDDEPDLPARRSGGRKGRPSELVEDDTRAVRPVSPPLQLLGCAGPSARRREDAWIEDVVDLR